MTKLTTATTSSASTHSTTITSGTIDTARGATTATRTGMFHADAGPTPAQINQSARTLLDNEHAPADAIIHFLSNHGKTCTMELHGKLIDKAAKLLLSDAVIHKASLLHQFLTQHGGALTRDTHAQLENKHRKLFAEEGAQALLKTSSITSPTTIMDFGSRHIDHLSSKTVTLLATKLRELQKHEK